MDIWRLPRGSKTPLLCSEVFDSDGKMKKEHFIDTSIFFRYDKEKTGKKSVWGGLGSLTEYRRNYDKSDCGG